MNRLFCLISCIVLISLGMALQVVAQEIPTTSQLMAVMNPRMVSGADSILQFEENEHSIGELSEDSKPVSHVFVGQNVSKHRVVIAKLRTTCNCTIATLGKKSLEPGDTTWIQVTFNPADQPGKLYTRVFVYADVESAMPLAALSLTGSVIPSASLWKDYRYSMGALRLRRKTVDFNNVSPGQRRSERIPCANAGSLPLHIRPVKAFVPDYIDIRTDPETLEPSQTGELVVTLNADKLSLPKDGKPIVKHVILDGLRIRPSERTLHVSVSGTKEQ